MVSKTLLTLAAAGLATAHYSVVYPEWRGDTLSPEAEEAGITQWTRPCAGVEYGAGNRTDWPIDGGSFKMSLGHAFNYVFINLGLEDGGNITQFNITLTPQPLNTTGHGELCIRKLPISLDNIPEGTNASIQVVNVGPSGNAMYNCADIRLTSEAKLLPEDECTNNGTQYYALDDQEGFNATEGHGDDHGDGHGSSNDTTEGEGAAEEAEDAPGAAAFNMASLSTVLGVSAAVLFGMTL